MKRPNAGRVGKLIVAAMASTALLAGCASGGDGSGDDSAGGQDGQSGAARIIGDQGDGGTPQDGGTLTYAVYSAPGSLDPAKTQVAGTTGGTEMAALYDMLMRYDTATSEFVPQLAKSMEESADRLTWTMKLREGVTFSDGSVLDANAVVASIERFNSRRGGNSQMYNATVATTEAKGSDTVEFTLKQPWSAFPVMFTFGHGMVVAAASDNPDGAFTPIGAGPFTLDTFDPPTGTTVKARADYWDGKPHLDIIKFNSMPGDQIKIDTLKAGGADLMLLRNPDTVNVAKTQFPGFVDPVSMGQILTINQAEGRPGEDVRVRQAIAHAVDPVLIDERARAGEGMPGSEIFQSWSEWHNDVPGVQHDPEKAKQLLDEAKADGYDGKITYLAVAEQNAQAGALAVQAQLNAVGFDVVIDNVPNVNDMVKKLFVDRDFDMSSGGTSLFDASPELRLFSAMDSTSGNNIAGINSPEIDAALAKIQTAATREDKVAAFGEFQAIYNEQVPSINIGAAESFIGWNSSVYGVSPSLDGVLLLGKAWIKK